jgi:hypothetical protein
MSDPIETRYTVQRFADGYRLDIQALEDEQRQTEDAAALDRIQRTLNAKHWHLQRHLDNLQTLRG